MKAIEILIELIKEFEGLMLEAYRCPAGVWTVGYGCTGEGIEKGVTWTQQYAEAELRQRANKCLSSALSYSPILYNESEGRAAAIADFIFNCGESAYKKSTLRTRIDAGDWAGAALEIKRWNKGGGKVLKGLVARREKEAQLLS